MLYIKQLTIDDCGFASLKNLLANLFHDSTYLYLNQDEKHGPYSYKELIEISQNEGVILKGYRFNNVDELKPFIDKKPMIVTLKEGTSLHAIVIVKIKKNKVIYLNPSTGKTVKQKDEFMSLWDKTGLVVEHYSEKKRNDVYKITSIKATITTIAFQLLSSFLMMIGILFLNENFWFGLSIMALGLAVVFDLIFRSCSFNALKLIDQRCISRSNIIDDEFDLFVKRLENYKKSFVTVISSIVSSTVMAVFVIFILILNNYLNIFLVFATFLIAILNISYFSKKEDKTKNEMKELESKIKSCDSNKEKISILNTLHDMSYKFGYRKYFLKAFESFILVILIILVMLMDGVINIQYVIFYFFIIEVLIKSVNNLLNLSKTMENHRLAKVELINILADKVSK